MTKGVEDMEKDKQLQDVVHALKNLVYNLTTTLERDYQIKVNIIWLDELVNLIATLPPEIIVEKTIDISNILKELYKLNPKKIMPMNLDIGLGAFLSNSLPDLKKLYPIELLFLCYWLLFTFPRRLLLFLNHNDRDVLYARCAEILQKDPQAKPYLEKAKKDIGEFVRNILRKKLDLKYNR